MCYYDQTRWVCGYWRWGHFRQQCTKEHRTGETCGLKLVYNTNNETGVCKLCRDIQKKQLKLDKLRVDILRWQHEGGAPRHATIDKAQEMVTEIYCAIQNMNQQHWFRSASMGGVDTGDPVALSTNTVGIRPICMTEVHQQLHHKSGPFIGHEFNHSDQPQGDFPATFHDHDPLPKAWKTSSLASGEPSQYQHIVFTGAIPTTSGVAGACMNAPGKSPTAPASLHQDSVDTKSELPVVESTKEPILQVPADPLAVDAFSQKLSGLALAYPTDSSLPKTSSMELEENPDNSSQNMGLDISRSSGHLMLDIGSQEQNTLLSKKDQKIRLLTPESSGSEPMSRETSNGSLEPVNVSAKGLAPGCEPPFSPPHASCSNGNDSEASCDESEYQLVGRMRGQIIESIMLEFDHWWDESFGVVTCTGEQSSQQSGSGSGTSHSDSSDHQICLLNYDRKRRRQVDGGNDDLGRSDDDEQGKPPVLKNPIPNSARPARRLACPYYQRNPNLNRAHRVCSGPGWETNHRVKEHVYRCHGTPLHCFRCQQVFDSETNLASHQRQVAICEMRLPDIRLQGFSNEQERLLRRKVRGSSEGEKRKSMYRILFPEDLETDMPSPYLESNQTPARIITEYDCFLRRETPSRVRQRIEAIVSSVTAPLQQELISRIPEIVREVQTELFRDYNGARGIPDMPVPVPREDNQTLSISEAAPVPMLTGYNSDACLNPRTEWTSLMYDGNIMDSSYTGPDGAQFRDSLQGKSDISFTILDDDLDFTNPSYLGDFPF
ncbi:hypothetical protein BJ170DRAFT_14852 [Xylariales sp. AK1849]|nr:hypothetical protein BJ170DRAFT_14852 [Xylariales sp. AK1849]